MDNIMCAECCREILAIDIERCRYWGILIKCPHCNSLIVGEFAKAKCQCGQIVGFWPGEGKAKRCPFCSTDETPVWVYALNTAEQEPASKDTDDEDTSKELLLRYGEG